MSGFHLLEHHLDRGSEKQRYVGEKNKESGIND